MSLSIQISRALTRVQAAPPGDRRASTGRSVSNVVNHLFDTSAKPEIRDYDGLVEYSLDVSKALAASKKEAGMRLDEFVTALKRLQPLRDRSFEDVYVVLEDGKFKIVFMESQSDGGF